VRRCVLVVLLSTVSCGNLTGDRSSDDLIEEENNVLLLLVLATAYSQQCESVPVVALSLGVASGPHSGIKCYVISTSGPATISVNSGGGLASITSKHPAVVGQATNISVTNPTGSITSAATDAKFQVRQSSTTQVTVTVN
jgi:hypothetical protein